MWRYVQRTGRLYNKDNNFRGYAGHGVGVNNPEMQNIKNVGPLPVGRYTIVGPPFHHPRRGPDCLRLDPHLDNHMYGRAGFLVHGDRIGRVGEMLASEGCIVLHRLGRLKLWDSADHLLEVIAEEPETPTLQEVPKSAES